MINELGLSFMLSVVGYKNNFTLEMEDFFVASVGTMVRSSGYEETSATLNEVRGFGLKNFRSIHNQKIPS